MNGGHSPSQRIEGRQRIRDAPCGTSWEVSRDTRTCLPTASRVMSTVAQQPVIIEIQGRAHDSEQSSMSTKSKPCLSQLRQTSPCFNRTRRVKTMTPPLQKGTAPQTKGRDVRIDLSTMCASLMMQDSQKKGSTGKIATVPTARTPSGLGSHGQG